MTRTAISKVILVLAVLVVSACQVDLTVDIEVLDNGSGTISVEGIFDAEAVDALGGVEEQLRLGDLANTGWVVSLEPSDDGGVVALATKSVGSRDQWQATLDEITGPGVFNDVRVVASGEFAKQSQTIEFFVDLSEGWELISDDAVTDILEGEPFGAPVEQLVDGRSLDDVVTVEVTTSVSSDDERVATKATAAPRFDDAEPQRVRLVSTTENSAAALLRWIAIALGALCALALALAVTGIVLQRRSDRLRPAPTPSSLASRVPGAGTAEGSIPIRPTAKPAPEKESVRLVVIEPLSVLYQLSQAPDRYLLPYVRHNGGTARADTILDGYKSVVTGTMDTASFWELCGLAADTELLDATFIEMRRLRPGAPDFLAEMQRRRIPVAAVSNDSARWSELTRERDRLSVVWPWLVSSEVGVTKPHLGMYELLGRESGVAHGHCLYVDTDVASLDAARELGMKTALLDTGAVAVSDDITHPVVTDFKGLFNRQ